MAGVPLLVSISGVFHSNFEECDSENKAARVGEFECVFFTVADAGCCSTCAGFAFSGENSSEADSGAEADAERSVLLVLVADDVSGANSSEVVYGLESCRALNRKSKAVLRTDFGSFDLESENATARA